LTLRAGRGQQKATRCAGGWSMENGLRPGGFGGLFGFRGDVPALEVTFAPRPFLHFVRLLTHKSLYIAEPFRILGRAL